MNTKLEKNKKNYCRAQTMQSSFGCASKMGSLQAVSSCIGIGVSMVRFAMELSGWGGKGVGVRGRGRGREGDREHNGEEVDGNGGGG
jgi:hypothetical protein